MESTEKQAAWIAEGEAARARQGAPGSAGLDAMRARSGLEFFEAMNSGELPPPAIGALMGFGPVEFEYGRVVFQGLPGEQHYNPLGGVHGGYAATLLDSCLGCAVHTTLAKGQGFTTLELKVNYVRPMSAKTGPIRAEGKIVSVTRQIGIAEGRITDANGKLLAYGTTTCLIFPI